MHKHYTYCESNRPIHIECAVWLSWQYATWLLPSLHILQVGLDAIDLLLSHCLAAFFFSDVIIMAKPLKNLLVHAKWIWHKIAQWPKRRLMVSTWSRPTWRMWYCGGMAATMHIAYLPIYDIATIINSHTVHSICRYTACTICKLLAGCSKSSARRPTQYAYCCNTIAMYWV